MDEEDDDDIYAPEGSEAVGEAPSGGYAGATSDTKAVGTTNGEDEEEGEELEEDGEDSDSDIDIITERKGETKREPTTVPRVKNSKDSVASHPRAEVPVTSQGTPTAANVDVAVREHAGRPGSSYPAIRSSAIDVDAIPTFGSSGKLITEVDMDADFPEDDKPWRRPGTDMTDYFNYGFDEFTWASYCLKQSTLRKEVADTKKQTTDLQSFLTSGMPGMPSMSGPPTGPPVMPSMTGLNEMPPEMQQMFQSMMAQGMDPMQMDPAQMMQMMQGGQMADMNQGFGGSNFGQQGQSQPNGAYGGYGGGGGNRNQGGRGQGRRW